MASKKALTPSACQRKSFAKINIDQYHFQYFPSILINLDQSQDQYRIDHGIDFWGPQHVPFSILLKMFFFSIQGLKFFNIGSSGHYMLLNTMQMWSKEKMAFVPAQNRFCANSCSYLYVTCCFCTVHGQLFCCNFSVIATSDTTCQVLTSSRTWSTPTPALTHTHRHTHTYTHTHAHTHTQINTHRQTQTHTHTPTHTRPRTHTHTHTHTSSKRQSWAIRFRDGLRCTFADT